MIQLVPAVWDCRRHPVHRFVPVLVVDYNEVWMACDPVHCLCFEEISSLLKRGIISVLLRRIM